MSSSPLNAEAPLTIARSYDSDEPSPVPSHDSFEEADDSPKFLSKTIGGLIAEDMVTSPLEALALACVAEKETKDRATHCHTVTKSDVLCGRGGLTNNAPGNIYFRTLVRQKQERYLLASKREKAGVAREIVDMIRSLSPPGRFLKKDSNGLWVEIGDRKAREKTSQALRENAPELRQEMQTGPVATSMVTTGPHIIPSIENEVQSFQPHPRKFFKPDSTMCSNRVRVVSDDAVLGMRSSLFSSNEEAAGSKRKVNASPMQEDKPVNHVVEVKRGPRLKLFKSRLMA